MCIAECDGVYPILKCPKTSKAKQRELLDQYWAQKKNQKKYLMISSVPSNSFSFANKEDERYTSLLNDVKEQSLGDSFADFLTISSNIFDKIRKKHPDTAHERFRKPVNIESAVKVGVLDEKSTASGKTRLALTIILLWIGLSVRIHDVEFLFAEEDMADVLLGRSLLKSMGLDLSIQST